MKFLTFIKSVVLFLVGLVMGFAAASYPAKTKTEIYLSGSFALIGMIIMIGALVYFIYSFFQDKKKPRYGYR